MVASVLVRGKGGSGGCASGEKEERTERKGGQKYGQKGKDREERKGVPTLLVISYTTIAAAAPR